MARSAPVPRRSVDVQASGWSVTAGKLCLALNASIQAIGPLSFDDKRRIIRWLCYLFGVDPARF